MPVIHAGIDTGTQTYTKSANYIYFFKITATAGGKALGIGFRNGVNYGLDHLKGALYTDSSGPDTLIAGSETEELEGWVAPSTWHWLEITSPPDLVSGTAYWAAMWGDTTWKGPDGTTGASHIEYLSATYASSWPAGATGSSSMNNTNNNIYISIANSLSVITVLDSDTLQNGCKDKAYSENIRVANGVAPYTFSCTGGALPDGLAVSEIGEVIGIPTKAGLFNFDIRVTDNTTSTSADTKALSIVIDDYKTYNKKYKRNPICYGMIRSIVKMGGTYYAFFEKKPTDTWQIYTRSSTDGIKFGNYTDGASSALLAAGGVGDFDEFGQADPAVLVEEDANFHMWYDALADNNEWLGIGYAYKIGAGAWTKNATNPVLEVGAAGTWDDNWVHHPCVIHHEGLWYMFYGGHSSTEAAQWIGVATSPDRETWTKYSGNPVIKPTGDGPDTNDIRPSRPVLINGVWHMWLWGYTDASDSSRNCLFTSKDLYTWARVGNGKDSDHGGPDSDVWYYETQCMDSIVEKNKLKMYLLGYGYTYTVGYSEQDIQEAK